MRCGTRCLLLLWLYLTAVALNPAGAADSEPAQEDPWSDEDWDDAWDDEDKSSWHGFAELAGAWRTDAGELDHPSAILGDLRLRLESTWHLERLDASVKIDGWHDDVLDRSEHKFREAALAFGIGPRTDFKLGRQVLTWGVGDLVFINDRFPKDFTYFAGRDDEYLKAPSDALRISHFGDGLTLDVALLSRFAPDEYFNGERFSFYLPEAGMTGIPPTPVEAVEPNRRGGRELALRAYRNHGGLEIALYGFDGFYRQPSAMTADGQLTYAPLQSLGASLRGDVGSGIGYIEGAWYHSPDETDGRDPLVPNDQFRLLLGFERELVRNVTGNFQYYLERMLEYDEFVAGGGPSASLTRENRHLLSTRLTYRARRDTMTWSLFAFYAPVEEDHHLRPSFSYRASDRWLFTLGANLFDGDPHTFFGQLKENSNVFLRLRFNY